MILDANIVLRYLLDDLAAQSDEARILVEASPAGSLVIADATVLEIVYVLKTHKYRRADIADALRHILELPAITYEERYTQRALSIYERYTGISYADAYVCAWAIKSAKPLKTFDKRLQKVYKQEINKQT